MSLKEQDQNSMTKAAQTGMGALFMNPPSLGIIELSGIKNVTADEELSVFDCASGPGVVGNLIFGMPEFAERENMSMLYGDVNESAIAACKSKIKQKGRKNARAEIIDAQDTKLADNSYTHILINYGIQLFPAPSDAIKELHRILKPGGKLAFSTHKHIGWTVYPERAQAKLGLPELMSVSKVFKEGWIDDSWIGKFEALGFEHVQTKMMENNIIISADDQAEFVGMIRAMYDVLVKEWPEGLGASKKEEFLAEVDASLTAERTEKGEVKLLMAGPIFVGTAKK